MNREILPVFEEFQDGNTLIPLRSIFEALLAEVSWNGETQEVSAFNVDKSVKVELKIGQNLALVNGNKYELEVAPQIINDSTYVPLRFVSEAFGANVGWNANDYSVSIELDIYNKRNVIVYETPELKVTLLGDRLNRVGTVGKEFLYFKIEGSDRHEAAMGDYRMVYQQGFADTPEKLEKEINYGSYIIKVISLSNYAPGIPDRFDYRRSIDQKYQSFPLEPTPTKTTLPKLEMLEKREITLSKPLEFKYDRYDALFKISKISFDEYRVFLSGEVTPNDDLEFDANVEIVFLDTGIHYWGALTRNTFIKDYTVKTAFRVDNFNLAETPKTKYLEIIEEWTGYKAVINIETGEVLEVTHVEPRVHGV
ncbi:copper amine oxidase N-terminal domain-containing protein [Bacillus sp. 3255]|uniref:copper amine oxidase N-terminal domain-containing protein n=1 Tax=Bacillus sp. 3255 TaxID=2817904 RepID=UPI00286B8F28|nr:copper amine oxidase N-terminal domain-containing protein [Bacillus sp. 3255]